MGLVSLALLVPKPILIFFKFVFAYLYLVNQYNSFHDLNVCQLEPVVGWVHLLFAYLSFRRQQFLPTGADWWEEAGDEGGDEGGQWWWWWWWGLHIISLAVLLSAGHLKMFLKIIIFWFCRLHFCSCLLGLIFKKSMQRRSWSSKKWRSASNVV